MFRLVVISAVCAVIGLFSLSSSAALVVLDQNTTIDASNSFPEPPINEPLLQVFIQAGPGGSPTVHLNDGGAIGGFVDVFDSSHLAMTGGEIEARTTIRDHATLTLSGGTILPATKAYIGVDVFSVLILRNSSTLNLRGGQFFPANILQHDESVINLFGHSFLVDGEVPVQTSPAVGRRFQGVFADGQPFDFTSTVGAPVFLYSVPEPSALGLALFAIIAHSVMLTMGGRQRQV